MSKNIIVAGSGPSYSGWPHWPTWTKMFPMAYDATLTDASGPAAGNKFLYRSALNRIQTCSADLVLMQWNLGKYDVYVENPTIIDQILNGSGVRNFLLDVFTGKVATEQGYWCSSHDNTVEWKRLYNKLVRSQRGTALDDLDSMINLQNICARKNIPYRFFCHDDIDHEFLSTDLHTRSLYQEIDWNLEVFPSVRNMYRNHESYCYDTSGKIKEFHWVPNANWQYWFLTQKISEIAAEFNIAARPSWDILKQHCHKKTLECYERINAAQQ